MKSCGIVAEYNPFHTGHRYHLQEARRQSRADVVVVAMSGNFVQRGEPAIIDKWLRTQQALQNGADLVLELPVFGSVQSADFFAEAAIVILKKAECQALSFGSEWADEEQLQRGLEQWKTIEQQVHQQLKEEGNIQSYAYPAQLHRVIEQYFPEMIELYTILQQPNQQLAFSYLKAMDKVDWHPEIYPIQRKGAMHHQEGIQNSQFASGTALRKELLAKQDAGYGQKELTFLSTLLLDQQQRILQAHYMEWEQFWPLLQYKLVITPAEQIRMIYQVSEGIEIRLKKYAIIATSFRDFIEYVKTKRWTLTKLQRVCMYILLDITDELIVSYQQSSYRPIQVLGFTTIGQRYLKQLHQIHPDTFVTNYAQYKEALHHTYLFDDLYSIVAQDRRVSHNIGRYPIRVDH